MKTYFSTKPKFSSSPVTEEVIPPLVTEEIVPPLLTKEVPKYKESNDGVNQDEIEYDPGLRKKITSYFSKFTIVEHIG